MGYSNLRGYATNRVAGALIVVARWTEARVAEVEVAGTSGNADGRRPIVAAVAKTAERATGSAAAIHK